MKKTFFRIMPYLALSLLMLVCFCSCGSGQVESASSAEAGSGAGARDALAGTAWTADVGEDYGAAVQGDDSQEPLTTLTLYFDEDGHAFNLVGDVSFDYKLNDDGTIDVSNLELGDTTISSDNFDLSLKDDKLVLHTRINGGNATLDFEKQTGSDEGDITDGDLASYAGTYTSEDGDTIKIAEDGSVDISIVRLCSMQGTAGAVYKDIMPITVTDPADEEMDLEFNTETKELVVTNSSWDDLKNGDSFTMDK